MSKMQHKTACAGQTAVLVKEKTAAKDLIAFGKQLQQLDPNPEEVTTLC